MKVGINKLNIEQKRSELLDLIRGHEEHLTSVIKWNQYSKEHDLPHSQTLIKSFGTWNKLKEHLSLEAYEQHRPLKYTDEMLNSILKEHHEHYTSVLGWNQYAESNNLPKHFVFIDRLGITKIRKETKFTAHWSTKEIIFLIKKHFPSKAPTRPEWDEVSKVESVPSYQTICRRFGTWNTMKHELYYK